MVWLQKFLRFSGSRRRPLGPVKPEVPLTIIADIHGCAALLERALTASHGQLVCVGDYVDRGPDSAGVLRRLAGRGDIICLMGNHEEMMLSFLDDPLRAGQRWLRAGGRATLASFDIDLPDQVPDDGLPQIRDQLRQAMGGALEDWLRALPSHWLSGNLLVTHAGADPRRAVQAQSTRDLRWGHPKFGQLPRRDGLWVLRGHVIQDEAFMLDGTIQIDTGAWRTGRLTLAHISTDGVTFEELRG